MVMSFVNSSQIWLAADPVDTVCAHIIKIATESVGLQARWEGAGEWQGMKRGGGGKGEGKGRGGEVRERGGEGEGKGYICSRRIIQQINISHDESFLVSYD